MFLLFVMSFENAAAQRRGPSGPAEVFAAPVKETDFADIVEAQGNARANESVIITPQVSERITRIRFTEGQRVEKGALLVELDAAQEQAELRSAEATLAEAESAYERAKRLEKRSALSEATLQERLAAVKNARARKETAEAAIAERRIIAPFAGVTGLREMSEGAVASPGDMIAALDDISVIRTDFNVPSVHLSVLKPGLTVKAKTDAFPEKTFTGKVHTVNTRVDPLTRSVTVRADFNNADGMLKPGLLMTVFLEKNPRRALTVPEEALILTGKQAFVYVPETQEGKTVAVKKEVQVGGRALGETEILAGLQKGDTVIHHGTVKLRDGAEIAVGAVEDNPASLTDMLNERAEKKTRAGGEE